MAAWGAAEDASRRIIAVPQKKGTIFLTLKTQDWLLGVECMHGSYTLCRWKVGSVCLSLYIYVYVRVHVYIHICGTRRVTLEYSDISEDVTAEQHHSNGSREIV